MKCKSCRRKVDENDIEDAGHWVYEGCKRWCRGPVTLQDKEGDKKHPKKGEQPTKPSKRIPQDF